MRYRLSSTSMDAARRIAGRMERRTDTHAPDVVRGTQPLRDADPFFPPFGIAPGDPMWLPPEERIVIW